jgi:hypothetical protein
MPSDTEVQQLVIYVGTQAKIDEARQAGTIGPDDFVVVTDAPELQTKLTSANAGNGIAITEVGGVVKISNTQTSAEWGNIQGSINTQADLWAYLTEIGVLSNLTTAEKNTLVGAINEVNGIAGAALQPSDVVNAVNSTATNKPLSANMGKELQDQIDNLSARGRFLALWNCATGLAQSNPPESPYTYKTGDYFIVGTVASGGGTNYKPNGATYTTGVASTTVETAEVAVDDVYYYDGTNWRLQSNAQKTLSFVNIAGDPYDNSNLAGALNAKVSGVTLNGTVVTPDSNYVVNLQNICTTNTVQTIGAAKFIVGTDYGDGMQKNIFAALSTESSSTAGWKGRMLVGAKNLTFLMGAYGGMAGLGAHSWTDSAAATGAAWADFYINPDGAKTVYIGGYGWKVNSGWFRVQNTGSISNGKIQVNIGDINTPNWKDVAYKGENLSDFNDDVGIVQSVNNITPVSGNVTLNAATFVDWVD